MEVLKEILRGANDVAGEAGINIIGGHTIDDPEPKFGLVVSGLAHPLKIWTNSGAGEHDAIILTKPIGTGILTTALKRGLLDENTRSGLVRSMSELNGKAAQILADRTVHACTDVTGFGLIGHLSEISVASGVDMELFAGEVPLLNETENFAAANVIPGGSLNNLEHYSKYVTWGENISRTTQIILCDAQTSGGLLFTIPPEEKDQVIVAMKNARIDAVAHIGNCTNRGSGKITVIKH